MVKRAIVLALSLACGACAAILGFERLSEDVPAEDDGGGIDASDDASPDAPVDPACADLGVPPRPDAGGGDAGFPLHFALSVLDLGLDPTRPAPGYNLDLACSTSLATSTCATTADPTTFDEYIRDREPGIDNAGHALLRFVAAINGETFGPVAINERLRRGEFGLGFRMSEWNEADDDDEVRLEIFPTLRVSSGADGGPEPSFGAGDEWIRDERFRIATDSSRFISVRAWVRARTLVAFFTDLTLPVTIPSDDKRFDLTLREVWLTARIDGAGFEARLVDGVFAGRWKTSDFLAEVRMISAGDYHVCEPPWTQLLYAPAKQKLCAGRDIHAQAADDGKPTACDAISVGVRFETYAVEALGPFEAEPPFSARCEDAGVPLGDDCP